MTEKEHKDIYIACAVGGVGLVLVLLYLFSPSPASAATNADGTPLPGAAATAPPGIDNYNYNIAPYNPDPIIPNTKSFLPANNNGGGCCDSCGPIGGGVGLPPNVAQFQTLLGTGAG